VSSQSAGEATGSWRGTYKSAVATMSVVPAWKKITWSDTKTTAGVGDGTIRLEVDATTGRVRGDLDGPLGPASIEGVATNGALSASVRRKDPSDRGFTGTLVGSIANGRLEGTMTLSPGQASVLRTATFALARDPSPAGGR
jgi:hypothetical protein